MIFAVTFYSFLTGCSKSSTIVVHPITPQYTSEFSDVVINPQPKVVNITKEGRVVRTTSQSGKLVIEAPEANTFNSDVVLTISESPSAGNESSLLTVGSIIYRITATRDGVPVNYLNHPLNITLSNEDKFSSAENFYIGIKEIESGDWQLINVYSSNPSARTSIGSKNQFSYSIYKTNILLALFADVKNSLANTPKVYDIVATLSPAILEAKDSAYTDDLKVTLNLSGENLSGLTSDNYNVKVTYLTSNTNDTPLKVDNKNVAYLSSSGKNKYEAFGEGYAHYFQFVPLSSNYTAGFAPSITFAVNLKNVKESDFPTDFIVELSNSDSKTLPFAYSSILSFSKESDSSSETNSDTDTETNSDTESDPELVSEQYKIVYHLDGGHTVNDNPTSYDIASNTIILNNPTKDGYTFIGWTGSNGDTPQTQVSIEKGSRGDKVYVANYSAVAYTISYNMNGGNVADSNPTGYNTASATFTLNNPTKEGYTFTGWIGSNGNTPQTVVTIETGSTENKTYTANYSLNSYNIVYNLDGGIFATENPTKYDITSDTITLYNPTKNGCTFVGWTYEGQTTPQMSVTITNGSTGDRVYNANYNLLAYNIALDLGGGNLELGQNNPMTYDVTSSTFSLPAPTKDYYRFIGWTGEGITIPQKPLQVEKGSTGDKSYTANYTPICYEISYNLDEGIADNPDSYDITSASITLNNPVKDGYSFIGWTSNEIAIPQMTVTIGQGSVGDRNYTASYTPSYAIAYNNIEDATFESNNPTTYTVYSEDITLINPTKVGYGFVGWTEGTATFPVMLAKIPQGSKGDKTYTAHWVESKTFTLSGGVTLVMHKIPAGTFTMGCPTTELGYQAWTGEGIQHQVTLSEFYIGKFEITQAQYLAVLGSNPSEFQSSNGFTDEEQRPVENVSWDDINTASTGFIDKINEQLSAQLPSGYKFDLPTEAQWEYACRAGTTTALNIGKNLENTDYYDSNLNEVAWNFFNTPGTTSSVGLKIPNAWGLYDMHGNVDEWCKDRYNQNYYTTCGDCTDPQGPNSDSNRVKRGGNSFIYPNYCRSANRSSRSPSVRECDTGFRLVLVPAP